MQQHRGEEQLRRHRVSIVGATYFVTACVYDRRPVLTLPSIAAVLDAELRACESSGHIDLLAFTFMPDHLHVSFRLAGALPVERVMARLKSKTRPALADVDAHWQPNFFEHRMRPDESLEPVIRYIFANPYRKYLLAPNEKWPWFWCSAEIATWFNPTTNDGAPFPEWLALED